jgi:hypothetical protein
MSSRPELHSETLSQKQNKRGGILRVCKGRTNSCFEDNWERSVNIKVNDSSFGSVIM